MRHQHLSAGLHRVVRRAVSDGSLPGKVVERLKSSLEHGSHNATMLTMKRAICALILLPTALLAQKDLGSVIPADRPSHMVAMGDYGDGSKHQAEVARAM